MEGNPSEVPHVLTLLLAGPGSSTTADSLGPYRMLCVPHTNSYKVLGAGPWLGSPGA